MWIMNDCNKEINLNKIKSKKEKKKRKYMHPSSYTATLLYISQIENSSNHL